MLINGFPLNSAPLNSGAASTSGGGEDTTVLIAIPAAAAWSLRCVIGGVDLSARLTGTVKVTAEEGAARVAEIQLIPLDSTVMPLNWLGRQVELYSAQHNPDGSNVETRRFFGKVASPDWDPRLGVLSLTCSDTLKSTLETMALADIDTLVGGYWLEEISGEIESRYDYAQQRMESVPAALDMGVDGQLRLTAWETKASPDFRFDDSSIIDSSLGVDLMSLDSLYNQVIVTAEYRHVRLRQREHTFNWGHPLGSFCAWRQKTSDLPTASMITDAIEGTGGALQKLTYMSLPASAPMADLCPGTEGAWINNYTSDPFVLTMSSVMVRRIGQTITETYTLTIQSSASMSAVGSQVLRETYSAETEFDTSAWEAADESADASSYTDGTIPRVKDTSWGHLDSVGDRILDKDDTALRTKLLQAAYALSSTKILATHRGTRVRFAVPVPAVALDVTHTAYAKANGCAAQGKIASLAFTWSIDTGEDEVEVALAISAGYGGTTDVFTQPSIPEVTDLPAFAKGTALHNQIADQGTSSESYNDALDGYSGNYTSVIKGTKTITTSTTSSDGSTTTKSESSDSDTDSFGHTSTTTTTEDGQGNKTVTTTKEESATMSSSGGGTFSRRFQATSLDIDAAYTDEMKPTTAATFEVAPPVDLLTLEAIP